MGLSAYKQIRFGKYEGVFGFVSLVINRPGFTALTQPAADTLIVHQSADTDGYSPFLETDFDLSKKFTTTKGRRAMDDLTISIRDGLGYTGTVNGSPVTENFAAIYQTFFDVWFDSTESYKCFIIYEDFASGNTVIAYEGYADPTYKPNNDPLVFYPGTTNQIWLGSRTIKITAFGQSQTQKTWQDVLNLIGPSDCQSGTPYNGFVYAPPGCAGKSNSRDSVFGTGTGQWYLAVPHEHKYDGGSDPILVRSADPVWPTAPWTSGNVSGIASLSVNYSPNGTNIMGHVHGYDIGDTGQVTGATVNAHYKFVYGGAPFLIKCILLTSGSGFVVGSTYSTTVSTGGGDGTLTVTVQSVNAKANWGPSGLVFITIGTLFAKIATALGLETAFVPSTDLKSALGWWAQKVGSNQDFPIDTSAAIPLDELYLNLNVIAQSHPYDGSYWDNPVGWSPDTPISDVLTGLANLLLADFNIVHANDGTSQLVLAAMGASASTLPAWPIIETPQQEEPSSGPRAVQTNNRGDDLKIQAPFGIAGDIASVEVPSRIRRISTTGHGLPDNEALLFDASKKIEEQADECLKVVWDDQNGAGVVNANCWKSLCFVYWFHAANANVVYPSTWSAFPNNDGSAGDWSNSFYPVNAIYKAGDTPPADLQAVLNGNDFFNTRDYHAVAFAALTLSLPIVQTFIYSGVADSTGSVQAITAGIGGTWRNAAVSSQAWRGIEVSQKLLDGITTIKWQAQTSSGDFPELSDIAYGVVGSSGGTSSTTGGSTLGGGVATTGVASFRPDSVVTPTGTGVVALTTIDVMYLCEDSATTGVTAPTATAPATLVITNRTAQDWTTGDFWIPKNSSWLCFYTGIAVQFDPTVATGWIAFRFDSNI